ncbi:nuclease-related domain-containing protein [Paenibacillus silvisoli]|uniref:nuclease-related domain-containing protein n=1 Tax=Paenibacillus silvisoli TaxID=3110539 RepID=UPI002805B2E9|nr:nuclease-related domain-containing protein [Paenibacillus silvisoli]
MVFIFIFLVLIFLPVGFLFLFNYIPFSNSEYRKETGYSYLKVFSDLGLRGEYYTVSKLSKVKGYHRLVVNVYLPKEENKTTEIDVVFLHESGVYVIESKNYSGWIFGREEDRNWMQVMGRQKNSFYNPIKQNDGHIKHLLSNVPSIPSYLIRSLIVFSERCTLKKIDVKSHHVYVFNRNKISKYVDNTPRLNKQTIDAYYTELKRYSNVPANIKGKHIKDIKNKQISSQS